MFRITAKSTSSRVAVSRAGARLRRLPMIILKTGQVIKLAPGQSVDITPSTFVRNIALLQKYADVVTVRDMETGEDKNWENLAQPQLQMTEVAVRQIDIAKGTLPERDVVDEPAPVEDISVDETAPVEEVVEEAPAPAEPEPAPVEEEPAPKKKSTRRKKKKVEDA